MSKVGLVNYHVLKAKTVPVILIIPQCLSSYMMTFASSSTVRNVCIINACTWANPLLIGNHIVRCRGVP